MHGKTFPTQNQTQHYFLCLQKLLTTLFRLFKTVSCAAFEFNTDVVLVAKSGTGSMTSMDFGPEITWT